MNVEALVLRAMLRLARRRRDADEAEISLRVGRDRKDVRGALRRLEGLGWVQRRPDRAPRLTLEGLTLALAMLPKATRPLRPSIRAPRAA